MEPRQTQNLISQEGDRKRSQILGQQLNPPCPHRARRCVWEIGFTRSTPEHRSRAPTQATQTRTRRKRGIYGSQLWSLRGMLKSYTCHLTCLPITKAHGYFETLMGLLIVRWHRWRKQGSDGYKSSRTKSSNWRWSKNTLYSSWPCIWSWTCGVVLPASPLFRKDWVPDRITCMHVIHQS